MFYCLFTIPVISLGTFIPASQRPDGSWRKPRRVKEGYVPQEEVPLYESKGKQLANNYSRQYPVGLDPAIIQAREEAKAAAAKGLIPGLVVDKESKKKKKKKKSAENGINEQSVNNSIKNESVVTSNSFALDEWQTVQSKSTKSVKAEAVNHKPVSTAIDPAKRLKNLKKKLREIETIEGKIESGEVKKPDKDQLDKVNRKEEVLSEILALELSFN